MLDKKKKNIFHFIYVSGLQVVCPELIHGNKLCLL